jgi:hypothetical protein
MAPNPKPKEGAQSHAPRRALIHLFDEFDRARLERDAAENRLARFEGTIKVLLDSLPLEERKELAQRFAEIQTGTQHRGGEVYGRVISFFKQEPKREWTLTEVQSALEKKGATVDPKAVANAVGYLTKIGRLQRVGRGQYIALDFGGAGFSDPDGPDDGTIWPSENDG